MITTRSELQSLISSTHSNNRQRDTNHRKQQTDQPKPLDNLGFTPSRKLKMVVERRHFKQSFASSPFEICHLKYNAQHHAGWDDRNHRQQDPLTGHQRHNRKSRTQRQRASVTHKKKRWMNIKPKKSKDRTNNGEAESSQISLPLQEGNPAVSCKCCGSN